MQNFSRLAKTFLRRNLFHDRFRHTTSFDSGYLIPIFADDVLPGDTYQMKFNAMIRFASSLIFPILDNVYIDFFGFFTPNRLVWQHWENLNGQLDHPYDPENDSVTDYLVPQVKTGEGSFAFNSFFDYIGCRPGVADSVCDAMLPRSYNLIANEWFIRENIIDAYSVPTGDGDDSPDTYPLIKRCKRHDYFTSCNPWPQRGPSVTLPIGTNAPVYSSGYESSTELSSSVIGNVPPRFYGYYPESSTQTSFFNVGINPISDSNRLFGHLADPSVSGFQDTYLRVPRLTADLSNATGLDINTLRDMFEVQRMYELDARSGTRYTEVLRSHFGVISPDSRLQRPELLFMHSERLAINTVVQTSATDSVSPQANLAAFGSKFVSSNGFSHSFVEHGWLLILACVRADLTYQQGTPRKLTRRTRLDYYWPVFAHLGEQAVYNKEIYTQGGSVLDDNNNVIDDKVFGYQERYAEYRYYPNMITGQMRSDYQYSLDAWHLSQDFANLPTLSRNFIEEDVPISRVTAVNTAVNNEFIGDFEFDLKRFRPLPVYGTPGSVL